MILSGKALRFLYLALAPSLCLTNELAVEGEECSACLACRQMKGVAEIHAVSVPLKGYLQSVRVWEYDIRQSAQFDESVMDRRRIESVCVAQDPLGFQHDSFCNKGIRSLDNCAGLPRLSRIISRQKTNYDVCINAVHAL